MILTWCTIGAAIIINFALASDDVLFKMENCASAVINYQMEAYAFVVSFDSNVLTSRITSKIHGVSYVLINANKTSALKPFSWRGNMYIIVVTTVKEYEAFFTLFYRSSAWNPRGTFFVIYLGNEDLVRIAELSWKHYTLNTFILDKSLKVYSYFPYKHGGCGKKIQVEEVYACGNTSNISVVYVSNIPHQFNKCPFTFQVKKIEPYVVKLEGEDNVGFEIDMLREISQRINTTLVFLNHSHLDWGIYLVNGTYVHMLADLFERKTNAIAGMLPAAPFFGHFDRTNPHSIEKCLFFVPAGKVIERWKNFQMVYNKSVWVSFLVMFVTAILAMWFGGLICNANGNTLDYWFFYTLCASLSSVPRLPRSLYLRYTLCLWILYFFVMNSIYQCQLLTYLIKPAYEKEISSYEELIESGFGLGGYPTFVYGVQLETSDPELRQQLTRDWTNYSLTLDCQERAAEDRNFGCLASETATLYHFKQKFLHPNGVAKLKTLRDKLFSFYACFYLDKGLPYYGKMNKLITRLMENGVFYKWVSVFRFQVNFVLASETAPLNIHHFVLPFVILVVGYVIAFCSFVVELSCHKI